MRRKVGLVGIFLSLLVVSTTIQWVNTAGSQSPTRITPNQIQPVELQRVKYLARAYVYEPQDFQAFEKTYNEYEDFRPFYRNKIEVQIDDYDASKIRDELLTEYDIIILTTPRDTLSEHDKAILEKFEASKGIVIPSGKSAYDQISTIRSRFENGELKSKQDIFIWEYHSANLDIYYPEVPGWFTLEHAQKNAAIAEQFYSFARDVVDEAPFHGGKIAIAFFKYRSMSMAGQMIRMGILTEEGRLFPPFWTFYHEMAHDFTGLDGDRPRTLTAGYINMNIAFGETIANLFACYFDSTFKYTPRYEGRMESFWRSKLQEYETKKINPYALNWHGHNEDQQYLEAMLFNVSDTYGWQTWNSFFRIAKKSGIPQPPDNREAKMEDLTQKDASLAFSRFFYLLSLGAGDDLRPQFLHWGFGIEPEVAASKVEAVKERPTLILTLSSNSVKTQDILGIKAELGNAHGDPVVNETLEFYLEEPRGFTYSLGKARTNKFGEGEISYKVDLDVGIYWVRASYAGSTDYTRKQARSQVVVNPLVWEVVPDGPIQLVGQHGPIGADLGQRYVNLVDINYTSSGHSLYYRFDVGDKIPSETAGPHVDSIWYQVLLDIDSDSSTGYHWSKDFTPDYILQLFVKFDASSGSSQASFQVMKHSGRASEFTWNVIDDSMRFGGDTTLAGGAGQHFLILTCNNQDIAVSNGSRIRFFARSCVSYDGSGYCDLVPDEGSLTMTVPLSMPGTSIMTSVTSNATSATTVQETKTVVSTETQSVSQALTIEILAIAVVAFFATAGVVWLRRRRKHNRALGLSHFDWFLYLFPPHGDGSLER